MAKDPISISLAVMMACTTLGLVPAASATGATCTVDADSNVGEGTNGGGTHTWCANVTGPGSIGVQDVITLGLGVCFTDPTFHFACSPATTNQLASAGAAFFDLSAKDDDWASTNQFDIWVDFLEASGTCGFNGLQCGFTVLACLDRDDNNQCTNVANHVDDLWFAEEGDENFFPGGTPCQGGKQSKGACGDGKVEIVNACGQRDHALLGGGDWDDWYVFVGSWVGAEAEATGSSKNYIGGGIAVGTFDVTIGSDETTCIGPCSASFLSLNQASDSSPTCTVAPVPQPFSCDAEREVDVENFVVNDDGTTTPAPFDVVVASCNYNNAPGVPPVSTFACTVGGLPFALVRTAICTAGTCAVNDVRSVEANLVIGATSVAVAPACGVAGASDTSANGVPTPNQGQATVADPFTCTVTFTWDGMSNGQPVDDYLAAGSCAQN